MLECGTAVKYPNLFQLVQYVNKCIFQLFHKKKFDAYDYVILDRWKLSMLVYGNAAGANKRMTKSLFGTLMTPDLTVLLVGDAFKRRTREDDSYERDKRLQDNVKREYVAWSNKTRDNFVLIDPQVGKVAVHDKIVESLSRFSLI